MHPNQKRLVTFLWVYEVSIITICALGAVLIATIGGGSVMFAIPVLLVAVAESLRVPLAAWLLKAKWAARIMGAIVLLAISVVSAEGLALIFEMAIQNRVSNVAAAQREFDTAKRSLALQSQTQTKARDQWVAADAEVKALDTKINELVSHQPQSPGFSGKTCGANHSTCSSDRAAQETYRRARRDYEDHKRELETARIEARKHAAQLEAAFVSVDLSVAQQQLKNAGDVLEVKRSESPMHRMTGAWFGLPVAEITNAQFEIVKRFIVLSLAIAFSTLSALLSLVAFSEPAVPGDDKLSRAWRGLLARLRKRVVKRVIVEVPGPETVRIRYVPVPDDGRARRALGQYESVGEKIRAFKEMV